MKAILNHFFWIIENLYSGTISLIFRFCLAFYLFILCLIVVITVVTWLICLALVGFIRSWHFSKKGVSLLSHR
jgi:hypothetical protein